MFLTFLVQGVSLGLPGTLPRCKSDAKGRKIESPSACCGTLSGPLWLSRLGARKVTTKSCYPGAPWGLTSVIGDPGLFLFGVTKRNKATTTKTQFGILCGTPPLLPGLDFWFLMLCCVSFVILFLLIFCKIFYRIFYEIFYKIFYNGLPKAPQIAAKSVKVWF